jgi:hypothetical protein
MGPGRSVGAGCWGRKAAIAGLGSDGIGYE